MSANDPIEQFNRRLDQALGLESAAVLTEPDPETQALLAVAARLADSGFESEARPSRALRALAGASPARPRAAAPRALARRWLLPAMFGALAMVLALVLVGPGRVLAALERWLGYVPAVGVVEDAAALRVLAEPVEQVRDGVTLRVDQAVANAEQTIILFTVEGLSLAAANAEGEAATTSSQPVLRLPDGSVLRQVEARGEGWGSGYNARLAFPALPPGVLTVTLEIRRLRDMPPGIAPEDWQLPLSFISAPPDMVVWPVIELATPTTAATTSLAAPATVAPLHGISLHVERLVPVEQGYLLYGSVVWDDRYPAEGGVAAGQMHLVDAAGQEIPLEYPGPGNTGAAFRSPWSLQTAGIYNPGEATLTLEAANVLLPEAVLFTFDPGPNPQEGQTWEIDQDLQVLGFPVHIHTARFMRRGDLRGFEFEFEADPALLALRVSLADQMAGSSGSGFHRDDNGRIFAHALSDMMLSGPVRVAVGGASLLGPWTATFTPPTNGQPAVTPTPVVQPCLTLSGWKQLAASGPVPLPDGVAGRLVGSALFESSRGGGIITANVDGTGVTIIADGGGWPSLSPDGTTVAYDRRDGLYVASAEGGPSTRLPGTEANDYNPHWSPDGQKIAFVRVADFNLYVMNADGSDLRRVTQGGHNEPLVAWSPDGSHLYFLGMTSGNQQILKSLDLTTGDVQTLFTMSQSGQPAIAPDAERVAFMDDVFGELGSGLFVSRPDGSQRRLVAQLAHWVVSEVVWSPDGQWLLIGIYDTDQHSRSAAALLHPDTCQVVPLPGLTAQVFGWVQ